MSGSRVYIAAADALGWEKMLLRETDFLPVGAESNGMRALAEIRCLTPDLLILESALAGVDGYSLLKRLGEEMIAPPRVLFLSRLREENWLKLAREKGADVCIYSPAEKEAALQALRETEEIMLPGLAKGTEPLRRELARGFLSRLNVPAFKGRDYMLSGAADCACAPHLSRNYSKKLYPLLAARFSTTPRAVERALRTAVEHIWLRGNLSEIQALFGFSVDAERGKPTNAEFLSMLSEHVRREGQKRLCHSAQSDAGCENE